MWQPFMGPMNKGVGPIVVYKLSTLLFLLAAYLDYQLITAALRGLLAIARLSCEFSDLLFISLYYRSVAHLLSVHGGRRTLCGFIFTVSRTRVTTHACQMLRAAGLL